MKVNVYRDFWNYSTKYSIITWVEIIKLWNFLSNQLFNSSKIAYRYGDNVAKLLYWSETNPENGLASLLMYVLTYW